MNPQDEGSTLSLALRRDRNYIYFPDAITECLKTFSHGQFKNLKAECYKTSDRHISARELSESSASSLFGRISWEDKSGSRDFALYETDQPNLERYDLHEPQSEIKISARELKASTPSSLFSSPFHRWTTLCKRLYHATESDSGRRLLLQRIVHLAEPSENSEISELIRLDFKTQDHFMKFSVWQERQLVGEVVAAARVFG